MKPGFFVVGAPKCGTTSLYSYLRQHPQVFLPRIKELNFFCTDLHFRFPLLTEKQFLSYYQDYKNEKSIGEVSVWNLYSELAVKNIFAFNKEAQIIILLRNPADMLYALHSNHVFNDNEVIADFNDALDAQSDRKKGLRISPYIKCPREGLNYYEVAAYGTQVKRYLDQFGRQKVLVILFDDFVKDTAGVYKQVLDFIKVDHFLPPAFIAYNESKTARSTFIKHMILQTPAWMKSAGRWMFPHQTRRRDWLMYWLWKINTKPAGRPPLNSSTREKIMLAVRSEMKLLQEVTGIDVSHWS